MKEWHDGLLVVTYDEILNPAEIAALEQRNGILRRAIPLVRTWGLPTTYQSLGVLAAQGNEEAIGLQAELHDVHRTMTNLREKRFASGEWQRPAGERPPGRACNHPCSLVAWGQSFRSKALLGRRWSLRSDHQL
jgi:hypothetical protein